MLLKSIIPIQGRTGDGSVGIQKMIDGLDAEAYVGVGHEKNLAIAGSAGTIDRRGIAEVLFRSDHDVCVPTQYVGLMGIDAVVDDHDLQRRTRSQAGGPD